MNKHLLAIAPLATVAALAMAAPADAATAYMDGIMNAGPGWHTMTMPDGSRCGVECREVAYDYVTPESAKRAALAWMRANNTPDAVLNAFSLAAVGATDARAELPDWQGTLNLVGNPAKPGNGATYSEGGRPVLDVAGGKVTIISTAGDSVALRTGRLSTHLNGYRGRDFSTEVPVKVSEPTEAVIDIEYGAAPKKSWAQRQADKRAERAIEREQRKIARAERRAERRERWDAFVAKLRGDKTTDVGRAAPVETQPSGPPAAAERPASANDDTETGEE